MPTNESSQRVQSSRQRNGNTKTWEEKAEERIDKAITTYGKDWTTKEWFAWWDKEFTRQQKDQETL